MPGETTQTAPDERRWVLRALAALVTAGLVANWWFEPISPAREAVEADIVRAFRNHDPLKLVQEKAPELARYANRHSHFFTRSELQALGEGAFISSACRTWREALRSGATAEAETFERRLAAIDARSGIERTAIPCQAEWREYAVRQQRLVDRFTASFLQAQAAALEPR